MTSDKKSSGVGVSGHCIRVKGGATAGDGVLAGVPRPAKITISSRTLVEPSGSADFGGQPAPPLTSGGASIEVLTTGRPRAGPVRVKGGASMGEGEGEGASAGGPRNSPGRRLNSGRTIVDASTTKRPFSAG